MLQKFIQLIILCSLPLVITSTALAGQWDGNWDSSYGQLRLVQSGDRVFGDYAEQGTIEGKLSADGRNLRGVFIFTDGRWGTFDWLMSGKKFAGTWRSGDNGITTAGDQKWSAKKTSNRPSLLKFADTGTLAWPTNEKTMGNGSLARFINFKDKRATTPFTMTEDYGPWYGGYVLTNVDYAYEILLYVDQIGDSRSGSVDLSISLRGKPQKCPKTMHPDFCRELWNNQNRSFVNTKVTGVLMTHSGISRQMYVAFELPGDYSPRILKISREATYYLASILHPERGVDYDGYADGIRHLCEETSCAHDVVEELRRNPNINLGVFGDSELLLNYDPSKDNRPGF